MPKVQGANSKWQQQFVITEEGPVTNHFVIQAQCKSKDILDDLYIDGRIGAHVTAICYLNGYRYNHKTHGESHGLRLVLQSFTD